MKQANQSILKLIIIQSAYQLENTKTLKSEELGLSWSHNKKFQYFVLENCNETTHISKIQWQVLNIETWCVST